MDKHDVMGRAFIDELEKVAKFTRSKDKKLDEEARVIATDAINDRNVVGKFINHKATFPVIGGVVGGLQGASIAGAPGALIGAGAGAATGALGRAAGRYLGKKVQGLIPEEKWHGSFKKEYSKALKGLKSGKRKTAQHSPASTLGSLAISNTISGLVGHHYGKAQKERGEKYDFGLPQAAGVVLFPGIGPGYQLGRYSAHKDPTIRAPKKRGGKRKTANVGARVGSMAVSNGIAGLVGHSYGRAQKERGEKYNFGVPQAAASLLLPGVGPGYQVGRYLAHKDPNIKKGKKKTAGELQGHTRSGRRPLKVETLLEKEKTEPEILSEVVKVSAPVKASFGKSLALIGVGAGGYHVVRQANEDRKLGKQLRQQQQ